MPVLASDCGLSNASLLHYCYDTYVIFKLQMKKSRLLFYTKTVPGRSSHVR